AADAVRAGPGRARALHPAAAAVVVVGLGVDAGPVAADGPARATGPARLAIRGADRGARSVTAARARGAGHSAASAVQIVDRRADAPAAALVDPAGRPARAAVLGIAVGVDARPRATHLVGVASPRTPARGVARCPARAAAAGRVSAVAQRRAGRAAARRRARPAVADRARAVDADAAATGLARLARVVARTAVGLVLHHVDAAAVAARLVQVALDA